PLPLCLRALPSSHLYYSHPPFFPHPISFSMLHPPPISTLFPYTTLFRSDRGARSGSRSPRRGRGRAGSASPVPNPSAEMALRTRSEEHTSELQSHLNLVCRLLLEKKKNKNNKIDNKMNKMNIYIESAIQD